MPHSYTSVGFVAVGLVGLVTAGFAPACASQPGSSFEDAGGAAPSSSSTSASSDGVGGISLDGAGGAGGGSWCASDIVKAQPVPLDMYIMLDQSNSMTKPWPDVTAALKQFVQQPSAAGIGVGIQYFALPKSGACVESCNQDSDCCPNQPPDQACALGPCWFNQCSGCIQQSVDDSCDAAIYAEPDVEIAPLPGVASAIVSSINAHSPYSGTPTSAALAGAIQYASAWASQNPTHIVVDVLATDGEPQECDTSLANIEGIAAQGLTATPSILTFVIGVGSSLSALDGIAAAGGTQKAFLVDVNADIAQQFALALNQIRGGLACTYAVPVPDSGTPDYGEINVGYTPGGGKT